MFESIKLDNLWVVEYLGNEACVHILVAHKNLENEYVSIQCSVQRGNLCCRYSNPLAVELTESDLKEIKSKLEKWLENDVKKQIEKRDLALYLGILPTTKIMELKPLEQ